MDPAAYRSHAELDERHWWWLGRRSLVRSFLERHGAVGPILNLGCGAGGDSRALRALGRTVSLDFSPEALHWAAAKNTELLIRGDATTLPFPDRAFRTCLLLDVVEHIEEDDTVLAEVARVTEPGGLVVVTVPAIPALWSYHDEMVHHKRRYTAARLRAAIPPDLEVERLTSFNFLLLPAVALTRLVKRRRAGPQSDFKIPSRAVNRLLELLFRSEKALVHRVSAPIGLSLLAVLRKSAGSSGSPASSSVPGGGGGPQ